ncbi:MAG: SPASM domain-containing protein [Proteobacteria bacterium]|nr:SPASM domain-containing protein [Pseudomonadota bacterium]
MAESCSRIFDSLIYFDEYTGEDRANSLYALEIYLGDPVDFGFSTAFINPASLPDEKLSEEDICDVINQAKSLGLKVIIFSGKEAASFRKMQNILSFAKELGIDTDILNEEYFCNANSKKNDPALCMRHRYSVVVTSYGYVLPCPGLKIPLGNIRYQKLSDIIKDSEILCDLKDYKNKIKGPCRICEKAKICYGCRGRSYLITGDYLAADSLCEKNEKKKNNIICLPIKLDGIIPQMPPMRIIDSIDKLAERSAECSALIKEGMPFMEKDGSIDNVAYFEMMAQSIAALNGFRNMEATDSAPEGYLLGGKKLIINSKAKVGDRLSIYVFKYAKFGGFGIVKGIIKRDNEVLAFGEIKIWHNTDQE